MPPGNPPSPPAIATLRSQLRELETMRSTLTGERDALDQQLTTLSGMLDIATSGLIMVDKSGLIGRVNRRAVEMLGDDASFLLKKPIALFIAPEDQALFYINRSRIVAGGEDDSTPFEIRFKPRNGKPWTGRVHARPVSLPGQHLPGLLLSVEDISDFRQVVENLQVKEYFSKLLFSIADDLSVWSAADLDAAITYTLERIGLIAAADRAYVGFFHAHSARFSVTHEWLADGIASPSLQNAKTTSYSGVMRQLKKRTAVCVDDVSAMPDTRRESHRGFHAPGAQAFLFAPLSYGRNIVGVIGCDAVGQAVHWSNEDRQLVRYVGDAIVGALVRKQAEKAPAAVRERLLQFVATPPGTTDGADVEYQGPIEILGDASSPPEAETEQWQIEAGVPEDDGQVMTAILKDGRRAHLACRDCYRQRVLDITEIRSMGTRLKATCICGNTMFIRVELRREQRKTVRLEGIFIRTALNQLAPASDEWGRIIVCNLSRRGVGFKPLSSQKMQPGDRFDIKFSLDNTAGSVIRKAVEVRSVAGDTIGCTFVGQDPCDVTIGFYMMT